jgi:hypothetical protein
MHMNIITMHGRNARMGSNPAAVSQFQFRAKPDATTTLAKRDATKRYRMRYLVIILRGRSHDP